MGSQARPSEDVRVSSSKRALFKEARDSFPPTTSATNAQAEQQAGASGSLLLYDQAQNNDMASTSRKRTATRLPQDESHSSADESAPIIRREMGAAKNVDYQSISPTITARTTGAVNGESREGEPRISQPVQAGHSSPSPSRTSADTQNPESSWWRRTAEKYGSVELENKGSVARDHLALERTFLAWLRTSLSFASIGIAVTQLFRLNTTISSHHQQTPSSTPQAQLRHVGKPLGATFIAISILILFIGFHRYFEAQHYVIRGKFPASRGSVLVVTFVAACLIVCSLVVILAVAPNVFER